MANKLPLVQYSGKIKEIASGDKIAYSKLALTGAVVDADLATTYIKADGTVALTANWNMGAFSATMTKTGAIAATLYDGFVLANTTPALLNAQQWSPQLKFKSLGWGTTAGTSQAVDYINFVVPTQGTVPTGTMYWQASIAGAAYATKMTLDTTGNLSLTNNLTAARVVSNIYQDATGNNTFLAITGSSPNQTITIGGGAIGGGITFSNAISGTSLVMSSTISGTSTVQSNRAGIAVTSTDGLIATNSTASTSGVPVQYSGRIRLTGSAWNTTATAASNAADWIVENRPVSGTTVTSTLAFASQINAGGYTDRLTLTSAGSLVVAGNITSSTGSGTFPNGLIVTNAASFTRNGVGITPVIEVSISNSTAAISGTPVQYSPSLDMSGTAWTGSASQVANFRHTVIPISGTTPITSKWVLASQINAAGYNDRLTILDTGQVQINTTPATNTANSPILVRNASTGNVEQVAYSVMKNILATYSLDNTGSTTENTVYTATIPANSISTTGSFHYYMLIDGTVSANNKVYKIKINGTTVSTVTTTNFPHGRIFNIISNTGALNTQVSGNSNSVASLGLNSFTATPSLTYAFDTSTNLTLTITVQNALGTETASVKAFELNARY